MCRNVFCHYEICNVHEFKWVTPKNAGGGRFGACRGQTEETEFLSPKNRRPDRTRQFEQVKVSQTQQFGGWE